MQRREPAPGLVESLRKLKMRHPDFCLGADIITGFPGETEGDFEDTVEWIKSVPVNYLHVFPYSERIGTKAVELTTSVPLCERLRRAAVLRDLSGKLRETFIRNSIDSLQDLVLIKNTVINEALASNYLRITLHLNYSAPAQRFNLNLSDSAIAAIHMQNSQ
jgi:threonylcarbamoyladenosine tRNA methylthiotransferase MtaB